MKLFETIESKWEHHCDAGMPQLLNYLATEGDEVILTKESLYREVNARIPYKGVVISNRQIQKNLDLLIEKNYIVKEVVGVGRGAYTKLTRGTGKGSTKKKTEIDFAILIKWYNDNIAINGRAKWIKATKTERNNIKRCQALANERGTTLGETLKKVVTSRFLMGWQGLGHYWIFQEDNFIKIMDGNYDNNHQSANGTATYAGNTRTATGGARTAADISRQRSAEQLIALASKRAERGNK